MRVIQGLRYAAPAPCLLDLYLPDEAAGPGSGGGFPLALLFHGGGLEAGSRDAEFFRPCAARLCAAGVGMASADYRLFPDARYPDFIEDAAAAVAWVKARLGEYGGDGRLYAGGFSAGAYLSMMLCFDPRWLGAHGIAPEALSGYIHGAGQPTTHFNVLKYRGQDPRRVVADEAAPLYHVAPDRLYAPMQIIVSDGDIQNRYEQTVLLMSTLKHVGADMTRVDYRCLHGGHCGFCRETDGEGRSVLGKLILEFVRGEYARNRGV